MSAWQDFSKEHDTLQADRRREEPKWRDLQRILDEDGEQLDPASRGDDEPDTFDSTPLYAKDDFIGGLFTEAMNPADPWVAFEIPDKDLEKWGPVAQWLWNARDFTLGTLDPSVSTFYMQASPWLGDLAMVGDGYLWQEENVGTNALVERALPFREMYRGIDAAGQTCRLHREFMLTAHQAKGWFNDRAPQMSDGSEAKFVHVLARNDAYVPGALGPKGKLWSSCYVSPDKRDFYYDTPGFFEKPVHEIRWERRGGRTYSRGPGHKALADMRVNDERQRSAMVAEQFMSEPMLLIDDENTLTASDIYPGNTIYGGISPNGKELVKHLTRGENMQYPLLAIEKTRSAIREAFYFSMFQLVNRPQMTATEFSGWKEEKLRMLARHLVSVQDGLAAFIGRRFGILQRRRDGRMPPPPPELADQVIRLKFTSPFAQVQRATEARQAQGLIGTAQAGNEVFPGFSDNYDGDEIARAIAGGTARNPRLVRDPRIVQQIRDQRQQQQAAVQQLEMAERGAGVIADVAHARQAGTLAAGRTQAA